MENNRVKALAWWRSMTTDKKQEVVEIWKSSHPQYFHWSWELIGLSSSFIQRIYQDHGENKINETK